MKTITMYDLLGLVKDGKAPKRIRVRSAGGVYDKEFYFDGDIYVYKDEYGEHAMTDDISIEMSLNDEVEILEEPIISKLYINNELQYDLEEKKIPDDLYCLLTIDYNDDLHEVIKKSNINFRNISEKLDKIIDYLDYLKSKGE